MRETGLLQVDVEYDFLRARRHHVLAALAHRLRRWRGDGNRLVPGKDPQHLGGPEVVTPIDDAAGLSTNSIAQGCLEAIEVLEMCG